MNARAADPRIVPRSDWFASWFDSPHYHELYAHRGDREAAALIDRLIAALQPPGGSTMLDLGCGAGRHSRYLAGRGYDVTGLDLSAASLAQARPYEGPRLRFHHQDMRMPFGSNAFDYVLSLFTSFGYFTDPADDVTVMHNIAAALRPGGMLVLDYLNVPYAEAHLVAEEEVRRGGVVYRISRWSDARHIFKRIAIEDDRSAVPLEYTERVARLTLEDFQFMLDVCDLQIRATFGDYDLSPFDPTVSPRLLLVAQRRSRGSRRDASPRQLRADAAEGFRRHAEV
jgi:SAM-dependent methyltransferase